MNTSILLRSQLWPARETLATLLHKHMAMITRRLFGSEHG
jgi:hypothetical protein